MLSLSALLAVAACGGDDDTNNAPLDWKNLDATAKGAYMGSTVLSEMTTVFQAFDATRYASMNCDTCHGPDGASVMFAMPNPNLPALSATLQDEFTNSSTISMFMAGMVVPRMASLLELTPVDPMTGEGEFGCFSCHTMK
ncbi:unnamed protein product [Laminaria digitata]